MGVKRPTYEQLGEMVEKFRGELQKRTQAEEELRESEQRHRLIFENAADGILLADRETKKFYMGNKQICEALGYSPEEIKKLKIRDIHPEEDLPYVFDQFEKLARNEISVAKDIPVKRKDGSVYYADISGFGQVLGEKACLIGVFRDITSRKKAEEALRQSEEKTRSIFRVAPVGIGVVRDRILEDVNFLICEMTGYSKEELVGNSARMLYPTQQDFDYVGTEKYRQIAERGIGIVETRWIKKDGNIIDILLASTPMDINDYSKGITFTALDITERKRAEEVLRQSELSYRTIFDSATDAIFLHDAETGRILEVNEAACHLWGYSREEFQASTLGMVSSGIPPYTQKEAMEWVRRAVKEGPQSFYWIAKRRDGTPIWLENSLKHIDIGGEERVLVVGRDITDRKRAEEETKRLAHENAIIAAIGRIVSSTLNIEEVYERFAEEVKKLILFDRIGISTFDLKHERVTIGYVSGQDIPDRRPGDHIPLAGSVMEELLKRRSSILLQTEKEEEWGECFPALLSTFQSGIRSMLAVPLFSKDQVIGMLHLQSLAPKAYTEEDLKLAEKVSNQIAGAIANAQLFTQHERSEAEKVNLQAQLQQSQKMEAIGRLAGGIAHDFNNLLTVISVQSQLALRGLKEGDPLTEKLKDIEKAADRAANLTRQLLAFSRRQILEMKVINLNIILTDIEKMLIRVIGEDIELKTILADELGMVKVDPGQMEQVIVNLAVNAKDAMPKGGKLLLETANAELDEEYTRSHVGMIPGAYVLLSITDTGIGMTEEVREQIFDPFFTTKEKSKGTGLGLSTVYGIVKQSGGDIYVYSEPGKGTTFKVYLPRVFEPPEDLKKATREEIFLGKEMILIVEDDRMVRRLAVDILRRQGYRVLEATEGGEALVMCEKEKEAIDLILTDIVMPHMSGPEFIERLRQVRKDFKVLYMTGYTDEAIVRHGILEEGIELIHKPFTIQKLSRKVREVLDKN